MIRFIITVMASVCIMAAIGLLVVTAPEWLPALCGGNCFR